MNPLHHFLYGCRLFVYQFFWTVLLVVVRMWMQWLPYCLPSLGCWEYACWRYERKCLEFYPLAVGTQIWLGLLLCTFSVWKNIRQIPFLTSWNHEYFLLIDFYSTTMPVWTRSWEKNSPILLIQIACIHHPSIIINLVIRISHPIIFWNFRNLFSIW